MGNKIFFCTIFFNVCELFYVNCVVGLHNIHVLNESFALNNFFELQEILLILCA